MWRRVTEIEPEGDAIYLVWVMYRDYRRKHKLGWRQTAYLALHKGHRTWLTGHGLSCNGLSSHVRVEYYYCPNENGNGGL